MLKFDGTFLLLTACLAMAFFCFLPHPGMGAEPLRILEHTPEGEVANLTQIVVSFSENIRPLGAMEQGREDSPLKITAEGAPLPKGELRWLGPATLAFLFEKPVDVPIRIRAEVSAGVKALSGAVLGESLSWAVATPPLKLSLKNVDDIYSGREESPLDPLPPTGAMLILTSNYALERNSLRKRLSLREDSTGASVPLRLMDRKAWPESGSIYFYELSVEDTLSENQALTLHVRPGLELQGGALSQEEARFPLRAFAPLRLAGIGPTKMNGAATKPGDTPAALLPPNAGIPLEFNNPVRLRDVLDHISIEPQAKFSVSDNRRDPGAKHVYLSVALQPRTAYTITLRPGLKDLYGTRLKEGTNWSFNTGDYPAFFRMLSGDLVLENSNEGRFPVTFRNLEKLSLRVRYFAWDRQGYAAYAQGMHGPGGENDVLPVPDREQTVEYSSAEEPNKAVEKILAIPQMLGFDSVGAMRGFVLIDAVYSGNFGAPNRDMNREMRQEARLYFSSMGLSLKRGPGKSLAWATDLDTGKALPGVELQLVGKEGRELWRGTTDAEGLAALPGEEELPGKEIFLTARDGSSFSVLYGDMRRLDAGFSDYTARVGNKHWGVHLVSQMPLYRPGQDVRFSLFAREYSREPGGKEDAPRAWLPLAKKKLTVTVLDLRGKSVHSEEALTDEYGGLSASFTLPKDAMHGAYRVRAQGEDLPSTERYGVFTVAEFRPPDFWANLVAPKPQPVPLLPPQGRDAPLKAHLSAGYFSGASLAGAKAGLLLRTQRDYFCPERLRGYTVGMSFSWPFFPDSSNADVQEDNAVLPPAALDKEGKAAFTLPPIKVKPGKPLRVDLEATVTDASGLASQGEGSFILHPSAVYVGLRAPHIAFAGKPFRLEYKAAGHDNELVGGKEFLLRAERLLEEEARDSKEPKTKLVWEKRLRLEKAEGDGTELRFDQGGVYALNALIKDAQGRENKTRVTVFVPGPEAGRFSSSGRGGLELFADKETYPAGETARVVVTNPFAENKSPAFALVSLERDGVRSRALHELKGPFLNLEIPLGKDDAPFVFVSVLAIRGKEARTRKETFHPWEESALLPQVRHARIPLRVEAAKPSLALSLAADAEEYRPGGEVSVSGRVALQIPGKAEAAPQKTRIILLAVDERILRAAGEKHNYDPGASFAPLELCGVEAADIRSWLQAAMLRERAFAPLAAAAEPAPKMAQGPKDESVDVRGDFNPAPLWLAEEESDARGQFKASFTLPDTITSYRIVAIAADRQGRFATSERSIAVNKPLQLLSSMPRFLVAKDALEARILVQNMSKTDAEVTVTAKAQEGLTLAGAAERSIRLKAGESAPVSFALKAGEAGKAGLLVQGVLRGNGVEERDAAEFSLPVLPGSLLRTVADAGALAEGKTHDLRLRVPDNPDPRSAVTVILAPSPASGLPLAATQVLEYPWHCLEQRMSRAWVRILRLRHGDLLGMTPDPADGESIAEALRAAQNFQSPEGGFSLWPGTGEADPYVSAYTLLVNSQARALGFSLPAPVEEAAYGYLARMLQGAYAEKETTPPGSGAKSGGLSHPAEGGGAWRDIVPVAQAGSARNLEVDAMVLWVLAAKDPALAVPLLPKLYEALVREEANLNPFAFGAFLFTARELARNSSDSAALPDLPERMRLVLTILNKSRVTTPVHSYFLSRNTGFFWQTLGSGLRDNGFILAALAECMKALPPETDLFPKPERLAAWLSQELGERPSLSTQEGAFGVWGLASYLQSLNSGQGASVRVDWNGKERTQADFSHATQRPESWTLPVEALGGPEGVLHFEAVRGTPYWTARLRYAVKDEAPSAQSAGLTIRRELARAEPGAIVAGQKRPPLIPVDRTPGQTPLPPASRNQSPNSAWEMGDLIQVSLTLTVPAPRRHVLVFDPFPAGLEPLYASRTDLAARATQGNSGLWQYQEEHDDGLLLYAPYLDAGVYTYTYVLRAAAPGDFAHRPAIAEEMYTPEVSGRSSGGRASVR